MDESRYELKLPGFRFHPTEEELLNFYLKSIVFGKKLCGDVIGLLNIYNYDPRDLPGLAKIGEREWYFFVPIERKRGSGGRPNRTTENGYWKATGLDRKIQSVSDPKKILGLKKTLVFYEGRAPRGRKTEWIMNEYRLPEKCSPPKDIVLCKIYMKATTLKVSEQRASMEEEEEIKTTNPSLSSMDSLSFYSRIEETNVGKENMGLKKEREEKMMVTEESGKGMASSGLVLPNGLENLGELQLPKPSMDWTQDSFWTQFSPWLDNFTPFFPMC